MSNPLANTNLGIRYKKAIIEMLSPTCRYGYFEN